jgi:hypothetical protein
MQGLLVLRSMMEQLKFIRFLLFLLTIGVTAHLIIIRDYSYKRLSFTFFFIIFLSNLKKGYKELKR